MFGSTTRLSTAVEHLWLARTQSGTTIRTESNVKNVSDVATALTANEWPPSILKLSSGGRGSVDPLLVMVL